MSELEQLQQQVRSLRFLVWAAAKSAGGRLVINYSDIRDCLDDSEIQRNDDLGNDRVIFTAT